MQPVCLHIIPGIYVLSRTQFSMTTRFDRWNIHRLVERRIGRHRAKRKPIETGNGSIEKTNTTQETSRFPSFYEENSLHPSSHLNNTRASHPLFSIFVSSSRNGAALNLNGSTDSKRDLFPQSNRKMEQKFQAEVGKFRKQVEKREDSLLSFAKLEILCFKG